MKESDYYLMIDLNIARMDRGSKVTAVSLVNLWMCCKTATQLQTHIVANTAALHLK